MFYVDVEMILKEQGNNKTFYLQFWNWLELFPQRWYINIPIITLIQEYNSTKTKRWKYLFQLLELVILKKGQVRILLLSVFPNFAFVNMKRNFNYEKFKRYIDICTILFPFLRILSYGIVFRLIRLCCVLKWILINFFPI